jgi:hypothetical protein
MKDTKFGFEYALANLQPIRTLAVVALVFQIAGALFGLWRSHYTEWLSNLWAGGALASFPGFIVGLIAQKLKEPLSISQNKTMVRRMGLVDLVLSLSVLIMPLK